jgi:hypothetical protein
MEGETMALSQAPARTASRPPADPQAVLSFLGAGHTTQQTAERFGIAERSVRRIRQRQDERNEQTRRQQRIAPQIPAERLTARSVATPQPAPHPTTNPTDTAGVHTLWRCPVTGELTAVPPGAKRGEWEAERRSPTPHTAPDPDLPDSPDRGTGHAFIASPSDTDSGHIAANAIAPQTSTEHNIQPVRRYPPRIAPQPRSLEWGQLVDLATTLVGPVPLIAWVIFGLALMMLGLH